jgi:hypothetical protein
MNGPDFLLRLFAFIATFIPVAGIAVTFLVASTSQGRMRYMVLILGPLLTALLALAAGKMAMAGGNMLAAVIYSVFLLFLISYYPVLAVIYVVRRSRNGGQDGDNSH